MKKTLLGNLLLLLAAIIWGFAFVAQVISVGSGLGPVSFNAVRFGIGALVLLPLVIFGSRKGVHNKKDLLIGSVISGVMLFFASNLQQYALTVNANPGLSGFITALYTVWTPIAYFVIFRKKTTLNVWVAVAVSIAGFYLLCMGDGGRLSFSYDIVMLLISTLFWTFQILSVDHFVVKVDPMQLSLGQYAVCTLLSFIYVFIFEMDTFSLSAVMDAKWSILYCGVLSVGVAYTLQVIGQKMTNPVVAVILMSTESVFSAVGGVLWNLIVPVSLHVDQRISIIGYIGCAVIFAGVIISQVDFSDILKRKTDSKERG